MSESKEKWLKFKIKFKEKKVSKVLVDNHLSGSGRESLVFISII